MNGFYSTYFAKNLIFMSARFNEQQCRFLQQAFEIPYNRIFNFPPRYQIEGLEVKGQELDEDAIVHENQEMLVQLMLQRIEIEITERPVIVFQGLPDQKLLEGLEKICRDYSLPFENI